MAAAFLLLIFEYCGRSADDATIINMLFFGPNVGDKAKKKLFGLRSEI